MRALRVFRRPLSAAGLLLCLHSLRPAWARAEAASSAPAADTIIRIGIAQRVAALTLSPEGSVAWASPALGRSGVLEAHRSYVLKAAGDGLRLGDIRLAGEAHLTPQGSAETIRVGARRYSGRLILKMEAGRTVTVVEEVGIEDYLRGVLPYEMEPDWPLEALKAQAVVARTFAYTHLGKHREDGFDLTPDARAQVYGGLGAVSPAVSRAVEETRGEVLGFKDKILPVYYHSCCGGQTTSAVSVWGSGPAVPPLRGVRDPYCRTSPHYRWSAYFTHAEVLAALASRLMAGPVRALRVGRRDRAGYAREFRVGVGSETLEVPAGAMRSALGPADFKSTKITSISRKRHGVEFNGRGSGHGVGLCQWGAREMARRGRSYENILRFYFPGAVLSVIDR